MQSETVWHQANKHNVPRIAFVNKLDRMGADFYGCIEQMKEKLGIIPAVCTIPAGQSERVQGRHRPDPHEVLAAGPDRPDAHEVSAGSTSPPQYQAERQEWREQLLEAASHGCDELLDRDPRRQAESPRRCSARRLRVGTLDGKLTPVHCGSSKEYHGVRLLLDAVRDYLPSPADRPPVEGIVPKTKEEAAAQARAERAVLRAWRSRPSARSTATWSSCASTPASCSPGDTIMNTAVKQERTHQPHLSADGRPPRPAGVAGPGEIVAVVGLKHTHTGTRSARTSKPIALEEIRFPEPVISQAIIPAKNVDETKLADALGKMVRDDPTLQDQDRPGDQPAHHQRHGRAAPGSLGRTSCSAITASR